MKNSPCRDRLVDSNLLSKELAKGNDVSGSVQIRVQCEPAVPELSKKLKKGHLWSPSYYVGTAGVVSANTIQKYIQNQKGIKAIPPPNKLGGLLA